MSDFEVDIVKGLCEASHFHPELEILFIIEGNATVNVKSRKYELKKEDALLINSNTMHTVESMEHTIIYRVCLSRRFIGKIVRDKNILFDTDKIYEDIGATYVQKNVKQILRELVFQYVRVPGKTRCMEESLIYQLLDCLIENYELDGEKKVNYKECSEDERLDFVLEYIGKNYMNKISLSDLADELYMSVSSLSRMFKKQTGTYFVDYVNQLRVRYAAKEIAYSTENITKIAMDCGFSNLSMFNKVFRSIYKISPSEYRNNMKEKKKEKLPKEIEKTIREEIGKHVIGKMEHSEKNNQFFEMKADVTQTEVYEKNWCRAINIGAVSKLARANLQFHTLYLMENLNIEYIRVWTIFSKKLQISNGVQTSRFNYGEIDQILDFLVSNHAKLILDFGRRPDMAFQAEGNVLFKEEEYIEFQTREAWESLFKDFLIHLLKRYGEQEVKEWIFEFSYIEKHAFPYYQDEKYDFFDVYRYGYSEIKKRIPRAEVGGFNGNIRNEYKDLIGLLERCKKNNCSPDFLSFVLFPYYTDHDHNERRSNEIDFEMHNVKIMKKLLKKAGLEDKKLYIMEWNCSVINRNILNDSTYRAAYITKIIAQIWNEVDLFCLWMGSDWVSSYYDSVGISYGGSGILTKDTICKPAYFAFQLLNQLGNELILKNEHTIITKKNNEYYLLCFNYRKLSSNYYMKDENEITFFTMQNMYEENNILHMRIQIEKLFSNGIYVIKKRSINEQEGSLLAEWGKFQLDTELDNSDVKYIRNACYPRISMEKKEIDKNEMELYIDLKPQEVVLLHIFQNE